MSVKSLVLASALAAAALGLSGCVDVIGPYGPYGDGYYNTGPSFLGGGDYRNDHRRYANPVHRVGRSDG